ncbi:hypothetical protein BJY52DRAFT_1233086 [Lactarius psammicola]|nr:hypothetical protein BJY52DRAFT_1233086 [Lactarius psammicola]
MSSHSQSSRISSLWVITHLQMLMVGSAAPSLQHLDAEVVSPNFPIPFSKFICDKELQFIAARLDFPHQKLRFYAETSSKSDHAQSLRIIITEVVSLEQIGECYLGHCPLPVGCDPVLFGQQ